MSSGINQGGKSSRIGIPVRRVAGIVGRIGPLAETLDRARPWAGRVVLLGVLLLVATSRGMGGDVSAKRFQATQVHMGTEFTLVFYAPDADHANRAERAAMARIEQLDATLSDFDPESELTRLSRSAPHAEPVPVSDDLWRVLEASVAWSRRTDGAFDVTVGPLTRLWRRARRIGRFPTDERLDEARQAVGYQFIRLFPEQQAVQLTQPNMRLDLGGIAKGYAIDQALIELARHGVDRALVNGGGDMAASGPPPGEPGWEVAVAGLDPKGEPDLWLSLAHQALATSGDAWQFVEFEGRRYSHILDPRTGRGVTQRMTVSVLAPNCTQADAMASSLCVLGADKGLQLIDNTPQTAARMVVIAESDEGPREYRSAQFHLVASVRTGREIPSSEAHGR